MNLTSPEQWQLANKNYLLKELERIRTALKHSAGLGLGAEARKTNGKDGPQREVSEDTGAALQPNLVHLCSVFELSSFERSVWEWRSMLSFLHFARPLMAIIIWHIPPSAWL